MMRAHSAEKESNPLDSLVRTTVPSGNARINSAIAREVGTTGNLREPNRAIFAIINLHYYAGLLLGPVNFLAADTGQECLVVDA